MLRQCRILKHVDALVTFELPGFVGSRHLSKGELPVNLSTTEKTTQLLKLNDFVMFVCGDHYRYSSVTASLQLRGGGVHCGGYIPKVPEGRGAHTPPTHEPATR